VDGLIEDLADPDTEQNQLWPKNEEQFGISLAIVVADEKARNIHEQRRSIRNLGEEKLKHLILRIFEDIKYDDYQDKEIATDFGLSKATFSRFAGSDWAKTKSTIPDLWLNTAKVLSRHDGFRQIALKAGYLKEVETTLEKMHFLNPETD
jgi:AraC-like DNA-binding protein